MKKCLLSVIIIIMLAALSACSISYDFGDDSSSSGIDTTSSFSTSESTNSSTQTSSSNDRPNTPEYTASGLEFTFNNELNAYIVGRYLYAADAEAALSLGEIADLSDLAYKGNGKYIEIPEFYEGDEGRHTVSAVGYGVFFGTDIEDIIIPDTVFYVAEAFYDCAKLNFSVENDVCYLSRWAICGNYVNQTSFSLRSDTFGVAGGAFKNEPLLERVNFNEGLTIICEGAFMHCPRLIEVALPKSLETIGREAFFDDGALVSAKLGMVKTIGDYAFSNCLSLAAVDLPDSLNSIGKSAFAYTESLKLVELPKNLQRLGEYAYYYSGVFSLVVKSETLSCIPAQCFSYCVLLNNAVFETDAVKTIGPSAFSYCINLILVVSSGINDIARDSFDGCVNLKYENDGDGWYIGKILMGAENGITKLIIKEGTEKINAYALRGQEKLTKIEIPETVTGIGDGAFMNCFLLETVTLPEGINTIEMRLFDSCYSLKNVYFGAKVTEIGARAFADCKSITEFVVPDTIAEIGGYAFSGDENLFRFVFPKNLEVVPVAVLKDCHLLTEVVLPDNANKIGSAAFFGCKSLENISLPNTLQVIDEYAFYLSGITSLVLPDSLKVIGRLAFSECNSLSEVTFSEGLEEIGDYAFQKDTALEELIFPTTLKLIGLNAFFGAKNLRLASVRSKAQIGDYAFYNIDSLLLQSVCEVNPLCYEGEKTTFLINQTGA